MKNLRVIIVLVLVVALLAAASSVCLAAEAKLTLKVELDDKSFWSYPYVTRDGKIHKPAAVQVEWTLGATPKVMKQKVVVADKTSGEVVITAERGAIIDLQVFVVDDRDNPLGAGSIQLKNTGQTVKFYVSLPDSTSPVISVDSRVQ